MMRTILKFGIYDPKYGGLCFSQEIQGLVFRQIPPVGRVLQFDRPLRDDFGRYYYTGEVFEVDGSEPIFAIVQEVVESIDFVSPDHFYDIKVEVRRDNDSIEHAVWLKDYVCDLQGFHSYLQALKKAEEVDLARAGFGQELTYFLQRLGHRSVADAAYLTVSSFEGDLAGMMDQLERALRPYGLQLSAGPTMCSHVTQG